MLDRGPEVVASSHPHAAMIMPASASARSRRPPARRGQGRPNASARRRGRAQLASRRRADQKLGRSAALGCRSVRRRPGATCASHRRRNRNLISPSAPSVTRAARSMSDAPRPLRGSRWPWRPALDHPNRPKPSADLGRRRRPQWARGRRAPGSAAGVPSLSPISRAMRWADYLPPPGSLEGNGSWWHFRAAPGSIGAQDCRIRRARSSGVPDTDNSFVNSAHRRTQTRTASSVFAHDH